MHRAFCVILCFFFWVYSAPIAPSQEYSWLLRDFDARFLTRADKRFLQASLAFEGHYNGLLDGDWGPISVRSMESYSRKEYGAGAADWHMAMLAFSYFKRFSDDGWSIRYFDGLDMSLLFPDGAATQDSPTEYFVNWRHTNSSLSYSLAINDATRTQSFHDFALGWHERADTPYTVRKTNFAVTTAKKRNGSVLYVRSNFRNAGWSTVMLSAGRKDEPILSAVAASISVGHSAPVMFTEGGRLDEAIKKVIQIVDSENQPEASHGAETAAQPKVAPAGGSGSGFFVSDEGHVLTNAHVVAGCTSVWVNGEPAHVSSTSEAFDLAILRTSAGDETKFAVFSDRPVKLNTDVTVAGYPYAGILGGLNVTRGGVSSLKGLGGEAIQMQITAPIQPGNSGGPVLASDGEVVGIVVSQLNSKKVLEVFGNVPQNVNFAVRGEIAKLFLSQNGVDPIIGLSDEKLDPIDLAEMASDFTAFVECRE